MKRSRLIPLVVAILILGMMPLETVAQEKQSAGVDFGLEGYYRVRYDNLFSTDWLFDDDSDWWTYLDQRMLLKPSFVINEKIRLAMDLDLLRNVTFGNNAQARVPMVFVDRNTSDVQKIDQIQFGTIDLARGNLFSQEMSNNNVITGEQVDPIQVRRLFGEVKLPIGVVRVGRQGSQFGMGLFSNAGDGLDDDYGDTYDRLLFGTKIGPYVPLFIYDKIIEDDFKVADTDVNQLTWVNNIKDIKWGQANQFDGGFYIMHRWQQSTDAKVWVYDLWLRLMLGGFKLETEAIALQGKMTMFDRETIRDLEENGLPTGEGGGKIVADAYLNANTFSYESDTWGAGTEFGFSSPADPNPEREFDATAAGNVAVASALSEGDEDSAQSSIDFINTVVENQGAFGTHVYTFPFDRDYNVDLIVWEVLMGGAVKNGMYAKVGGYLNPIDLMMIRLDLIKSWINESWKGKDGQDADHDLGWEVDMDLAFTVADHFTFGMQFGYAFPGAYFEDVYDNVENVYTLQSRFVFDF